MTARNKPPTEKLFDDIALFIEQSRNLLEAGAVMELTGLDDQVRTLCEAVLQLSQDDRVRYGERLQELLGGLKSLGDAMVERRDAIAEEIRGLSQHKKATSAYRIVEASDGYRDADDDQE